MITTDATKVSTFTTSNNNIVELLKMNHEISDLGALGALANYDQETALPVGASSMRGEQVATLQGILHDKLIHPHVGKLLDSLEGEVPSQVLSQADKSLIHQTRREYEQATKLPKAFVEEMARVQADSFDKWRTAREKKDFDIFAPSLEKIIRLHKEEADYLGYQESRYDALLDLFEPNMTTKTLNTLFSTVRDASKNIVQRVTQSNTHLDTSCLQGNFSSSQQVAFCHSLLEYIGYEFQYGEMTESPHPFTTSFGAPYDVRVTIHPDEHAIQAAIMAAIHEGGHALYEQGFHSAFARTLLANAPSLGAHESQSRLWENAIARSTPFWTGVKNSLPQEYHAVFQDRNPRDIATALNKVEPSLIRIEADEVTYNLHIIIRYEIESAFINGDIAVESLPRLWNEKYKDYLGITVPDDSKGILQDIHWSGGLIGYFPTYTLGNIYAAQLFHTLRETFPDFDTRLEQGDTKFILDWLRENIHIYGSEYSTATLMKKVTGHDIDPNHLVHYLENKFSTFYNLGQ